MEKLRRFGDKEAKVYLGKSQTRLSEMNGAPKIRCVRFTSKKSDKIYLYMSNRMSDTNYLRGTRVSVSQISVFGK